MDDSDYIWAGYPFDTISEFKQCMNRGGEDRLRDVITRVEVIERNI